MRGVDDWIGDKVETGVSTLLGIGLNSTTPRGFLFFVIQLLAL
jgi:hypothetical protein